MNASSTIQEILDRTKQIVHENSIVVVDDGSIDATAEIARRCSVHVIRHTVNRGKGAALQTGFDFVLTRQWNSVVTMDSDLQHKPEDIARLLQAYRETGTDIIIGSRRKKKVMPFHRILSNTITTFLVQARTGKNIVDSQSGFRFLSRRVLESVRLSSFGYEAETELLIKAAIRGFSFGSIPIDTVYAGEQSHMTHIITTLNFIKVLFGQY